MNPVIEPVADQIVDQAVDSIVNQAAISDERIVPAMVSNVDSAADSNVQLSQCDLKQGNCPDDRHKCQPSSGFVGDIVIPDWEIVPGLVPIVDQAAGPVGGIVLAAIPVGEPFCSRPSCR